MRHTFIIVAALLAACSRQAAPPSTAEDAAHAQAGISPDKKQQELWEAAAKAGPPPGVEKLIVDKPVTTRKAVVIAEAGAEQKAAPQLKALDTADPAAIAVVELPADLPAFTGTARVVESRPDVQALQLDLGEKKLLLVQVKVRNAPFRAENGETVRVVLRTGDPFARNDVLAIRAKNDDLAYALVGGQTPVKIDVPLYRLSAAQSDAKTNAPGVVVSVGGERRTLEAGAEAAFKAGLTVKVLASVAVPREAANAVPEPYRLEILAWRTGDRPAAAAE